MNLRRRLQSERGQGMTEYIITVALIGIAAIGIITIFGQNLRALWATSANALGGESTASIFKAGGGAQSSSERKGMANFGSNGANGAGGGGGGGGGGNTMSGPTR